MNNTEPRSQTEARFAVIVVTSAVLSLTLICPSADIRHAPALASAQDDTRSCIDQTAHVHSEQIPPSQVVQGYKFQRKLRKFQK